MERTKITKGDLADVYIRIGTSRLNPAHQFVKSHSIVYDCDEYIWRGKLVKDSPIVFLHGDGRLLPDSGCYNQISGPGVTFSGAEACADLKFSHALVCSVDGHDLIYNFVEGESRLTYVGKSAIHTLYIRIYDNNTGIDNDRWLVISME